jgi:hypothetical protein
VPAVPSVRPPAWISAVCVGLGALSFVAAWGLAFLAAPELTTFFYQPRALAVVHAFTLGWISLTMIGVLYQYVPSLTKQPITAARAAPLQVLLFGLGASGLITHFWWGDWRGVEWSGELLVAGAVLLAVQLLPGLLRAPRIDATVTGLIAALLALVGTALLGFFYAADKRQPFLPGSVLTNLAGHAHLGMVGWVTMTICAISYRMVAAFLLPTVPVPAAARWQVLLLTSGTAWLVAALLLRSSSALPAALLVVAAMAWYGTIIVGLARVRRMPIDWSLRHVFTALAYLAIAALTGLSLFVVDPGSELGSRLVLAYGIVLLVGWTSNYIVGIGTRMAPGLMGLGSEPLLRGWEQPTVYWLLNSGLVAVVASLVIGSAAALRAAVLLPLAASVLFGRGVVQRVRAARQRRRRPAE